MEKTCSTCGVVKSVSEFYYDVRNNKYKYSCKKCVLNSRSVRRNKKGSNAWWHRRYEKKKRSSKLRGYVFNLTFHEYRQLMEQEICYYCEETAPVRSIDRKDNSMTYTPDNCVMACYDCNKLKSTLTLTQIKTFYSKLVAPA